MVDDRRYRDEAWIESRYRDDEMTQQEIADECGVDVRTIRRWMNRHGIATRKPAGEYHGLYGEERPADTKEKVSNRLQGRTFSEETRERIAASQRGTSIPESVRRRISTSLTGRPKSLETRRKMAAARGCKWHGDRTKPVKYGAGWRQTRRLALERQSCCQSCGEEGSDFDLDVHHLVPVRHFVDHDELKPRDAHYQANLVVLCRPCHVKAEHDIIEEFAPRDDIAPSELETFIKDGRNPSNASR